ncbi:sigma-54-dependent Fis family transcriptional regulator [Roseibium denhamense]|uniref:DNA-binding transcriptional regulator NtrC n=1 Tax=Roseibium denhamense TaxID=76305 RepID=A0ABY1NK17_9HYPH|nr:sigma-54 dependent transcriptional regulator [Roseibium denhamense]MTI06821.1 sigma-54-dependent Fis family transcriptional regulator [Roseibium denhamense]SMP11631.1 DNA-binding transcriptional response regulator, NtrC family, contains REC, AAA-type ATPase, and a Fis-type DNA-binding domains [Roseibium denhamense]
MQAVNGRILIVDDDPIQRRLLEEAVKKFGYRSKSATNGAEAVRIMTGPEAGEIDLIILDMVMPELDGLGVLERLRSDKIPTPVIVQTAHGGIDTVVSVMNAGAQDFVVKPVAPERLNVSIRNLLKTSALEDEITRIRKHASGTLTFADIITRSSAMERVLDLGKRAASSNIPILIEGESGVGKEMIASAIQGSSDRRNKPLVTVNCGAIPDSLVESILFGHEKGAFTGAVDKHVGKFQEAHGGTLFLDEVGELPQDVQVKLLRALQEGEIDPIGARRPVKVDFRLISATNRRLIDQVKDGAFREDLYYRLNVFPIWIPPLRDRIEDIPALTRHFIARFAAEAGKPQVAGITPDALDLLQQYRWPGNIRQLENAVFRAVVLCDGVQLTAHDFPQVTSAMDYPAPSGVPSNSAPIATPAPHHAPAPHTPGTQISEPIQAEQPQSGFEHQAPFGFMRNLDHDGHVRKLADVEEEMIRAAITHYSGRMTEVAKRLGIGRSTLYRKLKEYGLDDNGKDAAA